MQWPARKHRLRVPSAYRASAAAVGQRQGNADQAPAPGRDRCARCEMERFGGFCGLVGLAGGPLGARVDHDGPTYGRTNAGTRRAARCRLTIASAVKTRLAFLARPRYRSLTNPHRRLST